MKRRFIAILLALSMCSSMFIFGGGSVAASAGPVEFAPEWTPKAYNDAYNGSDMWLRYVPVSNVALRDAYRGVISQVLIPVDKAAKLYKYSETEEFMSFYDYDTPGLRQALGSVERIPDTTLQAIQFEMEYALTGMLGHIPIGIGNIDSPDAVIANSLIIGKPATSAFINDLGLTAELAGIGGEGFLIKSLTVAGKPVTVIAANTELGALYGAFAFIRLIQTQDSIVGLDISDAPKLQSRRILSWERERLYAGNGTSGGNANGRNGESGFIFNFDLGIPSSSANGNNAHTLGTYDINDTNRPTKTLPVIIDRYVLAARALASTGINEFNLNNVNITHNWLSEWVIRQEAALADLLRPYGIKIALSAGYHSPNEVACNQPGQNNFTPTIAGNTVWDASIGTAYRTALPRNIPADATTRVLGTGTNGAVRGGDFNSTTPLGDEYAHWWLAKTNQIRRIVPDFVGWTMKAASEGQPGPPLHNDTHTTGSMLMGRYLAEANGGPATLTWRSFVYDAEMDHDRLNRAYLSFYDGDDAAVYPDHILIQNKNGPLDFQSREISHPMFGRMKNTNQVVEVQVTMEYLGFGTYMTFLGPLWEEFFKFDTYAEGPGTLVGDIVDGSAQGQTRTGMVGVNNLGNFENLTRNDFLQANTYSFGRQTWDWTLDSAKIAEEWARMTWSNDDEVVEAIVNMMMGSREAVVDAQNTLGLMHQQGQTWGGHYAPGWWDYQAGQDDWSPVYYNQAMKDSIGFRRTAAGRVLDHLPAPTPGAIEEKLFPLANQLFDENRIMIEDINTIPEELLLMFHNVSWDHVMKNGRTLYEELCYRQQRGVQFATWARENWDSLEGKVDSYRWNAVKTLLAQQELDMAKWRDTGIEYWSKVSGRDIPKGEAPLSIEIEVAGQRYGDFDTGWSLNSYQASNGQSIATIQSGGLSTAGLQAATRNYIINVPQGTQVPTIDAVFPFNEDAKVDIIKQAGSVGDTAIVKVTLDDVYDKHIWDRSTQWGSIVQNYTFEFRYANTLSDITVRGISIDSFDPEKTAYTVYADSAKDNVVEAVAFDPAATVSYSNSGATTTITVSTAGEADKVYTVNVLPANAFFRDDFEAGVLAPNWSWINEAPANWNLSGGSMNITTAIGNYSGATRTAENILLTDAPEGNWRIESKIDMSRAPMRNSESVGIIVWWDQSNYWTLRWQLIGSTRTSVQGTHGLNFDRTQANTATTKQVALNDISSRAAGENKDLIWLMIEKRGTDYIAYFSNNGNDWKPIRIDGSNNRPTLATHNAAGIPKVGLLTMQTSGTATNPTENMVAQYDYFQITQLGDNIEAYEKDAAVTVQVVPETGGIVAGVGAEIVGEAVMEYVVGEYVTYEAIAENGYEFAAWAINGSVVTNTAVFTFAAEDGMYVEALFNYTGADAVYVEVTVDPEGAAAVAGDSQGGLAAFAPGEWAKLKIIDIAEYYEFIGWFIDGELVSAQPELQIQVNEDLNIVAQFGKVVVSVIPSAVVEKQNGNKNLLTITITAAYADGTTAVVAQDTFVIDNNAAGAYAVKADKIGVYAPSDYLVYVNTKGNIQVREIYIVN